MDYQKAFIKCFGQFSPKHNRYQVMSDLALFGSTSLHNAVMFSQDLEDEYLQAAKRYDAEELQQFAELFAHVVNGLTAGGGDFLGQAFMALELGNDRAGQFFTPWHVSKLMASISHGKSMGELPGEFITLSEPTCGAGGMILAFAEVMREAGHNPQQQLWVQAWDIDPLPARLCYIQLALHHIPGEVIIGDSLGFEVRQALRTPAHYLGLWDFKLRQRQAGQGLQQGARLEHDPARAVEHECSTLPPRPLGSLSGTTPGSAVTSQFNFDF